MRSCCNYIPSSLHPSNWKWRKFRHVKWHKRRCPCGFAGTWLWIHRKRLPCIRHVVHPRKDVLSRMISCRQWFRLPWFYPSCFDDGLKILVRTRLHQRVALHIQHIHSQRIDWMAIFLRKSFLPGLFPRSNTRSSGIFSWDRNLPEDNSVRLSWFLSCNCSPSLLLVRILYFCIVHLADRPILVHWGLPSPRYRPASGNSRLRQCRSRYSRFEPNWSFVRDHPDILFSWFSRLSHTGISKRNRYPRPRYRYSRRCARCSWRQRDWNLL